MPQTVITYPEMNREIINLLRMRADDDLICAYAAARIEELEVVAERFLSLGKTITESAITRDWNGFYWCDFCDVAAESPDAIEHEDGCCIAQLLTIVGG